MLILELIGTESLICSAEVQGDLLQDGESDQALLWLVPARMQRSNACASASALFCALKRLLSMSRYNAVTNRTDEVTWRAMRHLWRQD